MHDRTNFSPTSHSVVVYGIAMDRGALEAYFSKRSRSPIGLHMQLATDERKARLLSIDIVITITQVYLESKNAGKSRTYRRK